MASLSLAPWSHATLASPSTRHFLSLLLSPWVTPLPFKDLSLISLNTYQPHSEKHESSFSPPEGLLAQGSFPSPAGTLHSLPDSYFREFFCPQPWVSSLTPSRDSTPWGVSFYPYSRGPVIETEETLPHGVLSTTSPESPSLIP